MKHILLTLLLCAGATAAQGQDWMQTNGPVEDEVLDLCIDSNSILYAVTRLGVNRSTNGGEHWTRPFLFPQRVQIGRVCIAANGNIIAAGDSLIYVSDDTANTFTACYEDKRLDMNPVYSFAVSGSGRIFTGRLINLIYSDDHGKTWSELTDESLRRDIPLAVAASHDTIIMHGKYHSYASFDNGEAWTTLNPSEGNVVYKVIIIPNGQWICLDYRRGLLAFIPDQGVWVPHSGPSSGVQFYTAEGMRDGSILVGYSEGLFQVTDTKAWIDISSGFEGHSFHALSIARFAEDPRTNVYYVATRGAGVWKRSAPLGTTRRDPKLTAFSVTPNPTHNRFTIESSESSTGSVSIELRDILGRIVWQQVENPATTISIEAPGLPPGNYLLVLRTNERTETQWVTIVE